ncbi:hypothetical protein FHX08_000691 [Rhizobium sp. BK529]|nr:hypothetical protein [Rhizobium sp. BK529]TCS05040.1 hypothetical protein EV281_103721 [Rhizobium sp. BK418]
MWRTFTSEASHSIWLGEISDVSPIGLKAFNYRILNLSQ